MTGSSSEEYSGQSDEGTEQAWFCKTMQEGTYYCHGGGGNVVAVGHIW